MPKYTPCFFLLACLISFFIPQHSIADSIADPIANTTPTSPPRICLVLKGGGALGFAHVGVLKVLEKNRVPVHCIAGTSMGAIVGAAYASGNTIAEMEQLLTATDWNALFGERIARETRDYRLKPGRNRELYGDAKVSIKDGKLATPMGVIQGQNIRPLFQGMYKDLPSPIDFDTLPVPFRAITADLESGQKYVPSSGDLATIVRASMSVPGAFSPVSVDGRLLIDGGIANNLPVEVALEMGADILIVVDLISELAKRENLTSPLSISGQMVDLLLLQNSINSRKLVRPQDVVIAPNVSAFTALQFSSGVELMKIGQDTAELMSPQLQRLSISESDYRTYSDTRTGRQSNPKPLDFVRLKSTSDFSEMPISHYTRLKEGDLFDRKIVEEDVNKLYQSGYFQTVQYTLVNEGDKHGLEIDVKEKEWLDNYFRVGFALEDDFNGNDSFRLGLAYRIKTGITEDGYGEIQTEVGKRPKLALELYQPFANQSQYFINPILNIGRSSLYLRDGDDILAEYARSELGGSLGLGRKLGTSGELAIGATRATGELDRHVGDPLLPEFSYDVGEFFAGVDLDTLDKSDFPTTGFALGTKYNEAKEFLGSDSDFSDISGAGALPWTFGRNTIGVRADYSYTFGERPVERSYSLGGFNSVSGFAPNSLMASDYVMGQILAFRTFSEIQNPLFNLAFFLGGTVEFTNLQNDRETIEDEDLITSGSVFLGGDTPLLPLYLAVGMADTGDQAIYLVLGRVGSSRR